MGKVKGMLEKDMMENPELYNGHAEEEFWIQCRKEELLEREGKPTIKLIRKGKYVRRQRKKSNKV